MDRKPSQAPYDRQKRTLSVGAADRDDDASKFDRAFEVNDIKVFVELLSSEQPIESFEERMHPWAEDPTTVGALAGTQLAILASAGEMENPGVKDAVREAGGIPPLVGFLRSGQTDRVQTAVVALSFLTAECPENTLAIYEAGAMPELLKHLQSPVAGMRAAAATTLRNICMEDEQYRTEFVQLGGLKGLVEQLACEPDPALNYADVQLEAILNIQDLMENDAGELVEEYAREALRNGLKGRLLTLLSSEDEEVRSSAEEVLQTLAPLESLRTESMP